jgi:hypothetical protein
MQAKIVPNPSETGKSTLIITLWYADNQADGATHSTIIWANIELNVGFIVAVVAPIRQLFQLIAASGKSKDDSTTNRSRTRTATFVDRSLVRIKDGDEEELVIQDVGNLAGTTLATSNSTETAKRHDHDDIELSSLGIISNGKNQ